MPDEMSPNPLALCIEDLEAPDDQAYLQCVALVGRQPGLRLDADGAVSWIEASAAVGGALELWVSLDQQLILYRPQGAAPVQVRRGGRSLDAPFDKPVVLLDGDQLDVGPRRLRLHVHGETDQGHAPQLFVPEPEPERAGAAMRATATALALGAVVGVSAGCPKDVEVRERPPAMEVVPPPKQDAAAKQNTAAKPDLSQVKPDQRVLKKQGNTEGTKGTAEPIQVRVRPPSMVKPPVKPVKPPAKPPTKPPAKTK